MSVTDAEISLAEFESLEKAAPDSLHVEFIGGRIHVTPAPDGDHSEASRTVASQIISRRPDLWLYEKRGLAVPAHRAGRARVDGAVAPVGYFRGQPSWADPTGVLMVVETTSGCEADARVDRVDKRDAYAQAGLPVCLLVDRHRAGAVVHWSPAAGRYQHQSRAAFGTTLRLPGPFDFDLDTAEFA
ncbi:Uma2 family endonuclease [Streptomyces sp. DSM 42041]|uniref:Uma2 family endonuclease n=1 Tax=Streptomyces hazeniae TaxID=3075538 RepID=A0ABU2NKZ5_9ACTN|nr:Uma2 family endonuclease [Streptomyces sp. DSM 42041]MDT0377660.1 Uma2 family endonuclease [Streptomyces sp. DSM 42041]